MASIRVFTASRGSARPASIIPSIAASTASDFIFMKSTSVLSRSKTMAWITPGVPSLGREADRSSQTDFAVVDADIEAAGRIAADPRLVVDGRSITAVIGEWQQNPIVALAALGVSRFHPGPLPSS